MRRSIWTSPGVGAENVTVTLDAWVDDQRRIAYEPMNVPSTKVLVADDPLLSEMKITRPQTTSLTNQQLSIGSKASHPGYR